MFPSRIEWSWLEHFKGILKLLFKCDAALVNDFHLWLIDPMVRDLFTCIVDVSTVGLLVTFHLFNA